MHPSLQAFSLPSIFSFQFSALLAPRLSPPRRYNLPATGCAFSASLLWIVVWIRLAFESFRQDLQDQMDCSLFLAFPEARQEAESACGGANGAKPVNKYARVVLTATTPLLAITPCLT
jgi:hypothetical protein